jgi:branched-chain amino acid transport system substrate-binding protein
MDKKLLIGVFLLIVLVALVSFPLSSTAFFGVQSVETIKIGWISDLSGSGTKYGAYEAGLLAVDEINASGGINGKMIELIEEDGKCDSKEAISAINKLINIDGVKFVLGGHCTTESMAIAPIVEKNKVLMLAAITSTPLFTNISDYAFRTSSVSTIQSELMAKDAINKRFKKLAIIYAQTSYAEPIAQKMKEEFTSLGGSVVLYEGFAKDSSDFRTILSKANSLGVDSFFFSAQTPDEAYYLLIQLKEMNLTQQIFGNDQFQNKTIYSKDSSLQEGIITVAPLMDLNSQITKNFFENYKLKYNKEVPFGLWTAESYDGVYVLAKLISENGEDVEKVKQALYSLDYVGASGRIRVDSNGDGIREYQLGIMKEGNFVKYESN